MPHSAMWPSVSVQQRRHRFEVVHHLAPRAESFARTPIFKVTYRVSQVGAAGPAPGAQPLALDVQPVRIRTYHAASVARPVWDARVYASDGQAFAKPRRSSVPLGEVGVRRTLPA